MVAVQNQISVIAFILLQTICTVTSFKCYVCSPDEGKPEDMYTLRKSFPHHKIEPCSKYNSNNKDKYLLECPHGGGSGCLTKFEANGSVMRNCAPIAIEDCKEANGVNYCYCKTQGCNTPERRLTDSPGHGHHSSIGHSQAAARTAVSDKSFTHYFDEEEGSGAGWGDFYYDDYNYQTSREEYYPAADVDDTEHDGYDGAHDNSDITEPPPFIDLEDPDQGHRHKYDRRPGDHRTPAQHRPYHPPRVPSSSDITIDDDAEDDSRPGQGSSASRVISAWWCQLVLMMSVIFFSEILTRTRP